MTLITSLRKCNRALNYGSGKANLGWRAAVGSADLCLSEDNKLDGLETEDLFTEFQED